MTMILLSQESCIRRSFREDVGHTLVLKESHVSEYENYMYIILPEQWREPHIEARGGEGRDCGRGVDGDGVTKTVTACLHLYMKTLILPFNIPFGYETLCLFLGRKIATDT